jgi:hypothetical protein
MRAARGRVQSGHMPAPAPQRKAPRGRAQARGAAPSKLKPVPRLFAVRCRPSAEPAVMNALRRLGSVRRLDPHSLWLVELPDARREAAAVKQLRAWHRDGRIEFFTPVLRDQETGLLRILTDEITVRFKADVPATRRTGIQRKLGVETLRQNEFVPDQRIVRVPQPAGLKTLAVARALDRSPDVEYATPNYISEYQR